VGNVKRNSASGLHGAEAKEWWRGNRTADIKELCATMDWEFKQMTPYQYRIERVVDVYPTNGRVHVIKRNWRGNYHTAGDLHRIVEAELIRLSS
jgi:hypothetical protein